MAVVVTGHNFRVDDADDLTNWGNFGGGGAGVPEPDVVWQGVASVSRKVGTTRDGRVYTHPSPIVMTGTDRSVCIFKGTITNPAAALYRTGLGMEFIIGSSSANYNEYYVHGSDTYPPKAGWIIWPVDPNIVTGVRPSGTGIPNVINGSPNYSAITYFGIVCDFDASSKSENVVIDCIDVGAGLALTGATGTFQDFANEDQGQKTRGRFGYVTTNAGIFFVHGRLAIGEGASAAEVAGSVSAGPTTFTDSDKTVVWENNLTRNGWNKLRLNLANASTAVSLTRCTLISRGEENNTLGGFNSPCGYDSRTQLEVLYNTGSATFTDTVFTNFNSLTFSSSCVVDGGSLQAKSILQRSGELKNCTIRTTSNSGVATLTDPTFSTSHLHDADFVQGLSGHALEMSQFGTYTFTNLTFTNYGTSGQSNAALLVSTTGLVTINYQGTAPTYRISNGGSVTLVNSTTLTLTNLKNPTEVRVFDVGTTTEIAGQEDVTNGTFAAGIDAATYPTVDISILSLGYQNFRLTGIDMTSSQTIPVVQQIDRQYDPV